MSLQMSFLSCAHHFHLGSHLPWVNRFLPGRTGNLARLWPLKTLDLGTLDIDTPIHTRPRRVYHYFSSYLCWIATPQIYNNMQQVIYSPETFPTYLLRIKLEFRILALVKKKAHREINTSGREESTLKYRSIWWSPMYLVDTIYFFKWYHCRHIFLGYCQTVGDQGRRNFNLYAGSQRPVGAD